MPWVRLAALSELEVGAGHRVELSDDEAVALIHTGEAVYALHGSRFDLVTGHPDVPPAVTPVQTFAVRVVGDDVLVDLPEHWAELAEQTIDSNVQ